MSESVEAIKKQIEMCTDDERRAIEAHLRKLQPHPLEKEWGTDASTILSAISRSSDLTKRGVRGIIAEAVFIDEIVPTVSHAGWQFVPVAGDQSYDALLRKGPLEARVQVKLQRLEQGKPKLYYPKFYDSEKFFVVEVQKTRTGKKSRPSMLPGSTSTLEAAEEITQQTRPYRFGDFDILAVNMHPSSGDWKSFRYTVASWLLPRQTDEKLIEIFQPVAEHAGDLWADDLAICLEWYESGVKKQILSQMRRPTKQSRKSKPPKR